MYLFTSINMLALMERPNQVHDMYRQINGVILNVKKWFSIFLFSSSCQKLLICHYEIKHKERPSPVIFP